VVLISAEGVEAGGKGKIFFQGETKKQQLSMRTPELLKPFLPAEKKEAEGGRGKTDKKSGA